MKSFFLTSLLGAAIIFVSTVLVFSMEFWAPVAFKMIESIGNYQLKPWVFFLPGFFVNLFVIIINPRYRNKKSILALFLGGAFLAIILVLLLFILAYFAMPNIRY
jgi:hypothetical protein